MKNEKSAITCTCKLCGRAFVKEVKASFWTETPSKRWRCPDCSHKRIKTDKPKKKRQMSEEQKQKAIMRLRAYKERREDEKE